MPPPILNDSEDEEDDVVYDDSVGSRSRSSGESVPGIPALDGTRDTLNQSTGSTGEHRRQTSPLSNLLLTSCQNVSRDR